MFMQENENRLPDSVTPLEVNGKTVYLVGTAHVSRQSVDDVRHSIEMIQPDTVCVELCPVRYKAITQGSQWREMNIFTVIKEGKALFLLSQLILNSFYRMIGKQLSVQPGAEMIEAIALCEKNGHRLVLADRDVDITLKRVWGSLNFWNKLKMLSHVLASLLFVEKIDEKTIEEIKNRDQIETILEEFSSTFPQVKKHLIDERDTYLAEKIKNSAGKTIVAVIGAGHVRGIVEKIGRDEPIESLMEIPPRSIVPTLFKWGIPAVIAALIIYGFVQGGVTRGIESLYVWIVVNSFFAAAGAVAALAHPVTIVAAFICAPVTSLNPMIAAGWAAGFVQAWIKKPTVADFERLSSDIATLKGFWTNPVIKILLVVAFCNLGSSIGTFLAGSIIATRVF